MTRAERAEALFMEGYNCTQSVVLAFAEDAGLDRAQAENFSRPLGGGMGKLRLTCGALVGAAAMSGLFFPELSKPDCYALVQEIARRFQAKSGSLSCGELLAMAGLPVDTDPHPGERTPEYYAMRPCPRLIRDAAAVLEEICIQRGKLTPCK